MFNGYGQPGHTKLFKNGDLKNHILNEHNIYITENIINQIFERYNLNHKVHNLEKFQISLTHISYLKKSAIKEKTAMILKDIEPISDEKKRTVVPLQQQDYNILEYRGDAVIHLALTQYLYNRYPNKNQGFLSRLRTKLEKAEMLSYLAKQLGLDRYVLIAKNMELNNAREDDVHLTEDIFEAFICALFLETGFTKCKEFIISVIEKEVDFPELINYDDNYKEKIMLYFHKMKWIDPKYIDGQFTQKKNGDIINRIFKVYIKNSNDVILGIGFGNTKSKAEQDAAYHALIAYGIIKDDNDDSTFYNDSELNCAISNANEEYFDYNSNDDNIENKDTMLFKDNDFTNHILNEKNSVIQTIFIDEIFKNYNLDHKVAKYENFMQAMVHISYLKKNTLKDKTAQLLKNIPPISTEDRERTIPLQNKDYNRLSHLGNAVIHMILTEYLTKRYYMKDQGFLTKLRAKFEKCETQSYLAQQLYLHKYAIIARNMEIAGARDTDINLTKGIFEAFIGALSLELHYESCYNFLITMIEKEIDFAELIEMDDNYKEKLMQYFHKISQIKSRTNSFGSCANGASTVGSELSNLCNIRIEPKYIDIVSNIETRTFIVHVLDNNDKILGIGTANTKNKAEQHAAYQALINLKVINTDIETDDFYGCS